MRAILCAAAILIGFSAARAEEEKIPVDKLPKAVAESVKKRFPKAELTGASKETVEKKTAYEVMLKDGKIAVDVNVNEDGTITGMEKEITVADLPKAIEDAVVAKYPKTKAKKAEEVIKVKGGKEVLEYYEVIVEVDGKDVEVEVLPDGKLKPMDKK